MKTKLQLLAVVAIAISTLFACSEGNGIENPVNYSAKQVNASARQEAACGAVGWASQNGGTIGGAAGAVTKVTTYATLKAAIESKTVKVIEVSGTITLPSAGQIDFKDQSAKTIYGLKGAKIVSNDQTKTGSGIMYMRRCTNVILRNLIFEGPGAYDVDGEDGVTIDECKNIWVDHCEFRDGVDGNCDIKNKSDFITFTYTKFNYLKAPKAGGSGGAADHRYTNLIGSSDGATGDRGKFRITFARCWWAQGCVERMPRVRFGKVHVVNSLFNSTVSKKCIQAGLEANILAESDVFENVGEPIYLMPKYTAMQIKNCTFTGTTGNKVGSGTAFTPPYSISVLSVATVKATVTAATGAGATINGNVCNPI